MDEATVARDLVAIIPLKSLDRAKERLAEALDSEERQALMVAMFDHVVRACQAADTVASVVVVAGDEDAAAIARRHGVRVMVDRGTGLNGAIATADEAVRAGAVATGAVVTGTAATGAAATGAVVTGTAATGAAATGAVVTGTATESGGPEAPPATLVVAADLPSASPDDIDLLAGLGTGRPCVLVAPTTDGGTGALLRRPGAVIGPAFGPGSAAAHVTAGARAGVRTGVVHIGGFAHDVDRPADLRRLGAAPRVGPPRQPPGRLPLDLRRAVG